MIGLIYDRLVAQGAVFAAVEMAEDVQSIVGRAPEADSGTVFICPWRENAGPPVYMGGPHRQRDTIQFVAAVLIRQADDPRGAARAAQFEGWRSALFAALGGWAPRGPDSSDGVCIFVGAESTGLGNGVSIYAQTWQVDDYLEGASP